MYRRAFVAVCAALMLSLTGCGGDSTGSVSDIAGTYTLISVSGVLLPVTLFEADADKVEVTAGSIVLNEDRTFSGSLTVQETESGSVTTETQPLVGRYSRSKDALTFTFTGGEQVPASISGNDLAVTADGLVYLFRR